MEKDDSAVEEKDEDQPSRSGNRKLALLIEYEGTRYSGFQLQSNAPSIQGELEKALKTLTREDVRIRGASRTDAGAHAEGQVIDFVTNAQYTAETFVNALNRLLPEDIKIRGGCETSRSFSARKQATARQYRYTVLNSRWPSPLLRNTVHWIRKPLDTDKMQEAAQYLEGVHDFSAFTVALPPSRSPVKRVDRWTVRREGDLVYIDSEADGFLPHQIRHTNGALADIGLGRAPVETVKAALDGQAPMLKGHPLLPAKGLCLIRVKYKDNLFFDKDSHET